jgi:uncharacterized membrane protein
MQKLLLISLLLLSPILREGRLAWPASYDFITIDVPNSVTTVALGINNQGQIVGNSDGHGFLLSTGTFTTIDVPSSQGTEASRINDRGQIVGIYGDASGGQHGFLLSGDTFTTIDVPDSAFTNTTGINNEGQIVGTFSFGGEFIGFLLSGGTITTFNVPDSFSTVGGEINERGQIVGSFADANLENRGFCYPGALSRRFISRTAP